MLRRIWKFVWNDVRDTLIDLIVGVIDLIVEVIF